MKKLLLHMLILVNVFASINTMKEELQAPLFLLIPEEMRLYIFEVLIKDIIENNSISEPFNNINTAIVNIILVNKEFNKFKYDLVKLAEKHVQDYFASDFIHLSQKAKDLRLNNIFVDILAFKNINTDNSKELEIEVAKLIIAGANPNLTINYSTLVKNSSLLMVISKIGKFQNLIKLLMQYGANIDAKDSNNNDALMHAAYNNHQDIVELLISAKSDVNSQNNNGNTALMYAAIKGHQDIVELLINSGSDVNMRTKDGDNALMYAISCECKNTVRLLLDAGADARAQSKDGCTALVLAEFRDYKDIVELIKTALAHKKGQEL